MKTEALDEQSVIHEAMTVLLDYLDPAKVAKFLAARLISGAGYRALRERLFAGQTVETLARKIHEFERDTPPRTEPQS